MSIARRQPMRSASICVRVAVQDRGVEHRREQVVGGADGVDVAGEVQVEVLHRDDLGHAAAGGAALDAEHRARARARAGTAPGCLPMAPRPWVRPTSVVVLPSPALVGVMPATHTSLPSGGSLQAVEDAEVDLRLVAAVGLDLVGVRGRPARRSDSIGLSSASCAISRLLFTMAPWSLVADGGGGELGHEAVLVEALEREGGDEVGRAARWRRARPASCRRSARP